MVDRTNGDEFYVDSPVAPVVRDFIAEVLAARVAQPDSSLLVERLRPAFGQLLAAEGWLPDAFAQPYAASGMGGGIGQYLLYRSADRALTLFSLVVPAGSTTPVHDHLAWGLVGLYRGRQRERVYAPIVENVAAGVAQLELLEERTLEAGDFYTLLPPAGDVHSVETTSPEASISIHLLGNDAGCVVRHRFDPAASTVAAFRSGYSNVPCEEPAWS
jgi:3-mercaptopropionate dioxygenase